MRNKQKISFVLAVCVIFLLNAMPVSAASQPGKGSIEIILTEGDIGTSKQGVTFEWAKVADLEDGQYVMLEKYKNVDLNDIEHSEELDAAAQKVNAAMEAEGEVVTDQEGKAMVSNLDIGVYLLRVSDKARYENVNPVLIAIPTWNEEKGDMDYEVTVMPKHSPNTPGTIITDTPGGSSNGVFSNIPTGDATSIWVFVAVMGVCVAIIIAYTICYERERRKPNEK